MPTNDELANRRRRSAWWLASARRSDPRDPKLADVAVAVGLKANSASTVSDWENNKSEPSLRQWELLAAYYGLPLHTFTDPQPTEQEQLDELRGLARAAADLALDDQAAEGAADGPVVVQRRSASPRRRSA